MLKVSRKLNKKYSEACSHCLRSRELISGEKQECEIKKQYGCYCEQIELAEVKHRITPKGFLAEYIKRFNISRTNAEAYQFINDNYLRFTHEELLAIILAFDCALQPRANSELGVHPEIIKDIYNLVYDEIPKKYRELRNENWDRNELTEINQQKIQKLMPRIECDDELKAFVLLTTKSF